MLQFIRNIISRNTGTIIVSIHLMLQFIEIQKWSLFFEPQVSIHLMLQFINRCSVGLPVVLSFQYISCCSLSCTQLPDGMEIVLFQYISCCSLSSLSRSPQSNIKVSIHLMLQFIIITVRLIAVKSGFNTSHVVVYRRLSGEKDHEFESFNTSHVVVYLGSPIIDTTQCVCFNTSHVVVYHFSKHFSNLFIFVSIHLMLQFILSGHLQSCSQQNCFNTSHVVVYRFNKVGTVCFKNRFNTSHVVVYLIAAINQYSEWWSFNTSHVVVYLLQFIYAAVRGPFQYISCCSLS